MGIAPPIEYLPFILAERFQGNPSDFMDMPVDRRSRIIAILGIEGEIESVWAEANEGADSDTDVHIFEWDNDIWDE